jgi:hypothetical protein
MGKIEQRIERMESAMKQREGDLSLLTDAELEQRIDVLLARMGTTRELVIAEHGSLGAFSHWLMCNSNDSASPEMNDGRTASERYLAMLG